MDNIITINSAWNRSASFRFKMQWLKIIPHMIRSYYHCCCINEPVIFSRCVHLKLGCRFHLLLTVCSGRNDIVPLIFLNVCLLPEYINVIMGMEESVQHAVMNAIQELMSKEMPTNDPPPEAYAEIERQLKRTVDNLEHALLDKEEIMQRCHELDVQVECPRYHFFFSLFQNLFERVYN